MPVELILFVLRLVFIFALYFFIVLVARVLSRELTVRMPDARAADVIGGAPEPFGAYASAAVSPGQAYLVMVDGAGTGMYIGTAFTLYPGAIVGRGATADIQLPDVYTSSEHARFLYDRGRWTLEDLKSMNGSYVNGQRVATTAPLGEGDTVQLGRIVLQFLLRPPT